MRKLAYRLRRAAVWLLVCSYVLCMHTGSASACLCVDAQEHERNEDALVRILEEYQTMGAAIVWIKQGEIVDSFYYGRANRADDTPVTKDTLFRIASVSKMVSAVGLLRLMDMGIFDLDEDIGTYLDYQVRNPWFKDTPITIRQIMTHTASFKDDGHYKKALNGNVTKLPYVLAGNYANTNFTRQEPGTVSDYSNFGGGLLGAFMELFTGMTLDEWMVEGVFYPLDILAGYHTPNLPEGTPIARIYNVASTGMTMDSMALTDVDYVSDYEMHYTSTAGALCIRAEDLAKILMVIAGDGSVRGTEILKPETVREMRTVQNHRGSVTGNSERGLNLNIIRDDLVEGRTMVGHQGKAYGMICAAYCDPTDQTGVVLLTNGCNISTFNTVARIAHAVMTKSYEIMDRHTENP